MLSDNPYPKFRFIDCEASGLHHGSYPIEVGIAKCDLSVQSFLLKPHSTWDESDWSCVSERIHGIPRDDLFAKGMPIIEAAQFLNLELEDKFVVSDNPEFDGKWLCRLFADAGISPRFDLESFEAALLTLVPDLSVLSDGDTYSGTMDRALQAFPRPHRAGPDALNLAAAAMYFALPEREDEFRSIGDRIQLRDAALRNLEDL